MKTSDLRGLPTSGADPRSLAHYEQTLAELQLWRGDPATTVERALESAPAFAMAQAAKAWIHLLGTEPSGLPAAREAHAAAVAGARTEREQGHAAAIGHLLEGRWRRAARVLEDVSVAEPRDALALLVGHQLDFLTGHPRMLRDRIARALPAWDESLPGYHSLLGMLAFGLEETGDLARAEDAGRRAVALEPRDGWAQHAVAHVLEMQARPEEGIAWMRADPEAWSRDSYLGVHNWWHLALFHLELGEIEPVLALFDAEIYGERSQLAFDMVDASALLWRLHLRGVDVGSRWEALSDNWSALPPGHYVFNDFHAVLAHLGAGRRDAALAGLDAQREALSRPGDNAAATRDVGHPLTQAVLAFADADFSRAIELLRSVRSISHRFGGSHAQRDLIDLTLLEAALRSPAHAALAEALTAERLSTRPRSPLSRLLAQRTRSDRRAG